jgi:regulator of nucleoside diphosphate kinase
MPKNVISINSRVQVRDIDTQKEEVYTVVLPHEATASLRQVSVLAPIGIALLGQRKGLLVEVRVPGGIRRLRIMQVTQSPDSPSKKELSAHGEITRTSFAETLEAH